MIVTVAAAAGAAAGAWLVAPFVSMARRGTIDDRARAAARAEADREDALRRARRREALVIAAGAADLPAIPAQRSPVREALLVC
ncbi:hypothetical protein [Actinomycetospora soli]|uniref:hypothetical protein n=1 Tax=Actinomycetospora soli TaxID=2893887 RepID=UPI001E50BBD9|nr:hypothetical protein [Actinomycetospora soli]MCD2187732.1 hypothetical protein [Actinomycetospora soli]